MHHHPPAYSLSERRAAPLAQWIEHLPSKQRVGGSNPSRGANSRPVCTQARTVSAERDSRLREARDGVQVAQPECEGVFARRRADRRQENHLERDAGAGLNWACLSTAQGIDMLSA